MPRRARPASAFSSHEPRSKSAGEVRATKQALVRKKTSPSGAHAKRASILHALRKAAAEREERKKRASSLERHESNPIITPNPENAWEAWQTFNPAALFEGGKVHIIYRAIGEDGISRFGYASSVNGIDIDERLSEPIFALELAGPPKPAMFGMYASGGSWGGAEDPRITKIGDRVYLFFIALDGVPQLAMSSIALDDFLAHRWHWTKPKMVVPPGTINKSGCVLPEKVNGKYVVLHRGVSFGDLHVPDIWIDYIDDINFGNGEVLRGHQVIRPRKDRWDSQKIGAGAPPIKTKYGWLLIYYAVGDRDSSRYKIGAMLLDLKEPEKVLYRSEEPILEPEEWYENTGYKAGIVYPCGAVVKDDDLYVYYGGADNYVCVAKANLEKFLGELMTYGRPKLEPKTKKQLKNASR